MLPTLAQDSDNPALHAAFQKYVSRGVVPASAQVAGDPPCVDAWVLFDSWTTALAASKLCERCPLIDTCLLEAFHVDSAYLRGEDLHGIHGTCGGVWFSQKHQPTRAGRRPIARELHENRPHEVVPRRDAA